jgi:hypothetical protein
MIGGFETLMVTDDNWMAFSDVTAERPFLNSKVLTLGAGNPV